MAEKKVSELDFQELKENLKTFLKSQDKFKDYDFDGSNLSVMLDILTYNTMYNGFYVNMLASEMFLDSAQLRGSVVSRAKHLGYTPRTVQSSRMKATIEIFPQYGPGPDSPDYIIIDTSDKFYTTINGKYYFFTPIEKTVVSPAGGRYIAEDVELIEGERLKHQWTVDVSDPNQKYILPNANVDSSSIVVQVKESENSNSYLTYNLHENITEIGAEDQVYFLQEGIDGYLEIYFGDGYIGKMPEDGNIIEVDYVVSSGDDTVGASGLSATNGAGGYSRIEIDVTQNATHSVEQESIESIKKIAPLSYEAQNRAITVGDYETILRRYVSDLEFVRIWGGEDNDPPDYGRVYVAAKPYGALAFTNEEKQSIIDNVIKPRNMVSTEVNIVDPEFILLNITSIVTYDSNQTKLSSEDVKDIVIGEIKEFRDETLSGFDADFRYSQLVNKIQNSDDSIVSNLTTVEMVQKIQPPFLVPETYEFSFNNEIDRGDATNDQFSVRSTGFYIDGILTYIKDNGQGRLDLYRVINDAVVIIKSGTGTIDYNTGDVLIEELTVDSLPDDASSFDLIAIPKTPDVISLREQIVTYEDEDITVLIEDINE
jgi:hypothetical protein